MEIVFIVGTGRCGSSLVHEVLARHEDTGFISSIDDNLSFFDLKGRWNGQIYRSPLGRFTKKGRLRFAPSEAYGLFSAQVSPIYADSARDLMARDVTPWLAMRTRALFEERNSRQGCKVFTHKYTGWPRVGFFAEIFPQAKFIHIIRDGRAVANSWLQMPWWNGYQGPEHWHWGLLQEPYRSAWEAHDRSFVALAGISWRLLIESMERATAGLGSGRFLQLRYEDILAAPRENFERMIEFSGLRWSASFEMQLQKQRFSVGRARAFEQDLTPDQCAELESSIGSDLLKRHGYL